MKNDFYFTSKALFVLKCLDFLVMYENGLIRKISKFMSKNLEIYVVTPWLTNNRNTRIAQYLKNYKKGGENPTLAKKER